MMADFLLRRIDVIRKIIVDIERLFSPDGFFQVCEITDVRACKNAKGGSEETLINLVLHFLCRTKNQLQGTVEF